jgi:hypothetical protein
MRPVTAAFFLAVALTACFSRVSSPEPELSGAAREAPNWVQGIALAQNANRIIMRANDGGQIYDIDISSVDFADCRIDCFLTVHKLDKIGPEDRLCIGFLYLDGGVQAGKVWVNRHACPGPTIAP